MCGINRIVGFLSAPDWLDPAPDEFRVLTNGQVAVQQTFFDPPRFDYTTGNIAKCEPQLTHGARHFASAGCSLIASPATPFGLIGHRRILEARARLIRISQAVGVDCISSITAILDILGAWQVKKAAPACTYYLDGWRDLWASFVANSGLEVAAAASLVNQGIRRPHGSDDIEYPTPMEICGAVRKMTADFPEADVIVVTGSGARTVAITDELRAIAYSRVIAADAALFSVIAGKLGVAIPLFAILVFFGLTGMPWLALVLICTVAAWKVGGLALGIGTALGLLFIVTTGIWSQTTLSIYLCGIAVLLSFGLGTGLGIWAAHNDRVSKIIRPFNDTLQTMPLFGLLIPFVMIFKIGEFTALLAIIAYAIVPAIRYAEHGLRSLPEHVIEAARMIGATNRQLLWQVKIHLAFPVMMLGLNPTIMYGIAMLVIAALVGTNDLEKVVYIGLSEGDFWVGLVAGMAMAIIAIITDRMTSAWSRKRQLQLGIATR